MLDMKIVYYILKFNYCWNCFFNVPFRVFLCRNKAIFVQILIFNMIYSKFGKCLMFLIQINLDYSFSGTAEYGQNRNTIKFNSYCDCLACPFASPTTNKLYCQIQEPQPDNPNINEHLHIQIIIIAIGEGDEKQKMKKSLIKFLSNHIRPEFDL